jgi:hypothetical protein
VGKVRFMESWNALPRQVAKDFLFKIVSGPTICSEKFGDKHAEEKKQILKDIGYVLARGERAEHIRALIEHRSEKFADLVVDRLGDLPSHKRDVCEKCAKFLRVFFIDYFCSSESGLPTLTVFLNDFGVEHEGGVICGDDPSYLRKLTLERLSEIAEKVAHAGRPKYEIVALLNFWADSHEYGNRDVAKKVAEQFFASNRDAIEQELQLHLPCEKAVADVSQVALGMGDWRHSSAHAFCLLDDLVTREIVSVVGGYPARADQSNIGELVEQLVKLSQDPRYQYRMFHRGFLHGMLDQQIQFEADFNELRRLWYLVGYYIAIIRKGKNDLLLELYKGSMFEFTSLLLIKLESEYVDKIRLTLLREMQHAALSKKFLEPVLVKHSADDLRIIEEIDSFVKEKLLDHEVKQARLMLDLVSQVHREEGVPLPTELAYRDARCCQLERRFGDAIKKYDDLLNQDDNEFRYAHLTERSLARLSLSDVNEMLSWLHESMQNSLDICDAFRAELPYFQEAIFENELATNAHIAIAMYHFVYGGEGDVGECKKHLSAAISNIEELYRPEYSKKRLIPVIYFLVSFSELRLPSGVLHFALEMLRSAVANAGEEIEVPDGIWKRYVDALEQKYGGDIDALGKFYDVIARSELRRNLVYRELFTRDFGETRREHFCDRLEKIVELPSSVEKCNRLDVFVSDARSEYRGLARDAADCFLEMALKAPSVGGEVAIADRYLEFLGQTKGAAREALFDSLFLFANAAVQVCSLYKEGLAPKRLHFVESVLSDCLASFSNSVDSSRNTVLAADLVALVNQLFCSQVPPKFSDLLESAESRANLDTSLRREIRKLLVAKKLDSFPILFVGGDMNIRRAAEKIRDEFLKEFGNSVTVVDILECYRDDNSSKLMPLEVVKTSSRYDKCLLWVVHRASKHAVFNGVSDVAKARGIRYLRIYGLGSATMRQEIEREIVSMLSCEG